ncbi:MAG: hypothetical protein ABI137_11360, partial [Antricoccus sp.]
MPPTFTDEAWSLHCTSATHPHTAVMVTVTIDGGRNGGNGGTVTINGGTVTATGGGVSISGGGGLVGGGGTSVVAARRWWRHVGGGGGIVTIGAPAGVTVSSSGNPNGAIGGGVGAGVTGFGSLSVAGALMIPTT